MTPSENAAIACIQFKSFSFKRRKNPSSQFNNLKILHPKPQILVFIWSKWYELVCRACLPSCSKRSGSQRWRHAMVPTNTTSTLPLTGLQREPHGSEHLLCPGSLWLSANGGDAFSSPFMVSFGGNDLELLTIRGCSWLASVLTGWYPCLIL